MSDTKPNSPSKFLNIFLDNWAKIISAIVFIATATGFIKQDIYYNSLGLDYSNLSSIQGYIQGFLSELRITSFNIILLL